MSVIFLILEQTIKYLHRRFSSQPQILFFQTKKNRGFLFLLDFYLGSKYAEQNYLPNGLIWIKFDLQIFHQAHFNKAFNGVFASNRNIYYKMIKKIEPLER